MMKLNHEICRKCGIDNGELSMNVETDTNIVKYVIDGLKDRKRIHQEFFSYSAALKEFNRIFDESDAEKPKYVVCYSIYNKETYGKYPIPAMFRNVFKYRNEARLAIKKSLENEAIMEGADNPENEISFWIQYESGTSISVNHRGTERTFTIFKIEADGLVSSAGGNEE